MGRVKDKEKIYMWFRIMVGFRWDHKIYGLGEKAKVKVY